MSRAALALVVWLVAACSMAATSPVVAVTNATGQTICSAFAVRPRRLVTAAHCVHSVPVTYVREAPVALGRENADVVTLNADQDWAVLEPAVDLPSFESASIKLGAVDMLAIRGPGLVSGAVIESYFDGLASGGSDVLRWSAALDVEPGWSGSPLLQDGRAVGILQSCRGYLWPRKSCVRPGFAIFFPVSQVPL